MNPCNQLEKLFHEPKRLAITSVLCSAPDGLLFNELKDACDLTDGNLSRHLKALQESAAVSILKTGRGRGAATRVHLTDRGREGFLAYLTALESVLQQAMQNLAPAEQAQLQPTAGRVKPA